MYQPALPTQSDIPRAPQAVFALRHVWALIRTLRPRLARGSDDPARVERSIQAAVLREEARRNVDRLLAQR